MRGLADREDDVVRQLREQEDVGDVRVERLLEEGRRLAGREDDDRRLRVLPDLRDLVLRERRRPRRVRRACAELSAMECTALACE